MSKYQEALDYVMRYGYDETYDKGYYKDLQEAVDKVKKYDEKETPMKPIRIYPPFGDNVPINKYPKIWGCPNCKEQIIRSWKYCPVCGYKLGGVGNEQ